MANKKCDNDISTIFYKSHDIDTLMIFRLVDSSYQADSLHRVSNRLQLGPLKRSDLNSILTCQV